MNILSVCEYLKNKLNVDIKGDYYGSISQWEDWYKGYYKPFHHYTDYNGRETVQLDRYSLKMAKKVCEDWANMLLNEETKVVLENKEAQKFVDGVFERNDFFANANTLIEKTFALGTGAIAVRLNNYKVRLEYITADCIIPISYDNRSITEVAFVSEHTYKGKPYIYLETHLKNQQGNYVIRNEYLDSNFNRVKTDNKTVAEYDTKSPVPWFVILKPNITNNVDLNSPMGISVYANSTDVLKGVDLAYDNLCTDFFLGGKMVLMNESIIAKEQGGNRVVPQHSKKRLFMSMGDSVIDGKMYEEYNPQLRVDENVKGVQSQLNYLSSKCGLGERYYSFEFDRQTTENYEPVVKSYADGGKLKQCVFSLCLKEARVPLTKESISNIGILKGFLSWLKIRDREGNFPLPGNGISITAITDVNTEKADISCNVYSIKIRYVYQERSE